MATNKKLLSIAAACLLILLCVFFMSCSGSNITGKYYLSCIYNNGKLYQIGSQYNGKTLENDYITAQINSDNTGIIKYTDWSKTIEEHVVWYKYDDCTYVARISGSSGFVYIDSGTIAYTEDGTTYILKK